MDDLNLILYMIMEEDCAYIEGGANRLDKVAWEAARKLDKEGKLHASLHKYVRGPSIEQSPLD